MMKFDETGSVNYHGEAVKFYTPTRKTAGRGNLLSDVPLPPQDFDWGGVIPLWNR